VVAVRLRDAVTLLLAETEAVLLAVLDTDGVCRREGIAKAVEQVASVRASTP
jgi:hypothetical protein